MQRLNVKNLECIEIGAGRDLKDLTVLQGLAEHERQNSSARLAMGIKVTSFST